MIKPISRLRFVKVLTPYTNGEHLDDESMKDIVTYRQAKKIEVIGGEGFAFSLDGEIIYSEHFTVEIAPVALEKLKYLAQRADLGAKPRLRHGYYREVPPSGDADY